MARQGNPSSLPETATDTRETDRESGTVLRGASARPTVLIADDDDDARLALKELLVAEGYDVIDVADGACALELLASAADHRTPLPDVILLDFVMPGYSGLGILRAMRAFGLAPPTILMTAFPDPSVETFARNLGAVRVLRKPVDASLVCKAVLGAIVDAKAPSRGA